MAYADAEANRAIRWYWNRKRSTAMWSRSIRFTAFTLTALGGLLPIGFRLAGARYHIGDSGMASSLCLGLAAGLIGLDKAFGFSSGWARYVLTATVLERALENFRMQWTLLIAKSGFSPGPEQIAALLKCATEFRMVVTGLILTETKDWINEFKTNLIELERETRVHLDLMRTNVESDADQSGTKDV